jgi:hypothetical protein
MRNACATSTIFLFWFLAFFGTKARTFLASLDLSRRSGLKKSWYMILESGYYLHHKNLAIRYSFVYYKEKSMVNYCIIVP